VVRDSLARLKVNGVANASGGRNGSDTECVQVLRLKFGVVVYTRVDGVVVEAGGLRNLLTSREGYRVANAGGDRDWVDGERLLFVVAEGCRSLGECAGNILFVFEGLSASKTGGAVVCQWV
jgi:hypothetical protein